MKKVKFYKSDRIEKTKLGLKAAEMNFVRTNLGVNLVNLAVVVCFVLFLLSMVRKIFEGKTPDVFPGIIARNKTILDYEKFVHSKFYPYIIHPYSLFRVYYEILITITYPLRITVYTFMWGYLRHDEVVYLGYTLTSQFLVLIDIILMFITGYVEKGTEIVILDPKQIAIRYLMSSFVLDLLAVLPIEYITYLYDKEAVSTGACDIHDEKQLIMFVTTASFFFGTGKYFLYLRNTSKVFLWNPFTWGLLSTVFGFNLIVILNMTLFFFFTYYFGPIYPAGLHCRDLNSNIIAFFKLLAEMSCNIFFLYAISAEYSGLLEVPAVFLSFFFNITFTACLVKYYRGKLTAKETGFILESKVRSMARKRHLPKSMKQKMLLYFRFLLQNKFRKEDAIFNYFPDDFKADVISFICLPLIKRFYAFEDLPSYVLRRLAESLKYQLHLPNEVVTMKSDPRLSMYFVQKGTVALYSENNVELYHFEDGSCFYGRSLIEGKPEKRYYAVSIEVSEVYRLDYADFMDTLVANPRLLESMKEKLQSAKSDNYDFYD